MDEIKVLKTLIKLLEFQENIKIDYTIIKSNKRSLKKWKKF